MTIHQILIIPLTFLTLSGIVSAQPKVDINELEDKVDKLLRGSWKSSMSVNEKPVKLTLKFMDGRLTILMDKKEIPATYKVVDEQTITITLVSAPTNNRKTKFKVDKDKLTMEDKNGKMVFTREPKKRMPPR